MTSSRQSTAGRVRDVRNIRRETKQVTHVVTPSSALDKSRSNKVYSGMETSENRGQRDWRRKDPDPKSASKVHHKLFSRSNAIELCGLQWMACIS